MNNEYFVVPRKRGAYDPRRKRKAVSRLPDGATDEKKTALRGGFLFVRAVFRLSAGFFPFF